MTPRSFTFAAVLAASLISFSTLPGAVAAQDAPLKIAVVNMDQVIAQSAAGVALSEKLQAHQTEAQALSKERGDKIEDLRKQISEGVGTLDQAQLVSLQSQFEAAQTELRDFRDAKEREALQIRTDGLREMEKQIEPVFVSIQEEFDYDLILNQQPGLVLMVGDRVNITQMVIDRSK